MISIHPRIRLNDSPQSVFLCSTNMGLGSIFSRALDFGRRLIPKLAPLVPKVINGFNKVVPKVIGPGGFIDKLPGLINRFDNAYNRGRHIVKGLINELPDSGFKRKLNDLTDKTDNVYNKVKPVVDHGANTARVYSDAATNIVNKIQPHVPGMNPIAKPSQPII